MNSTQISTRALLLTLLIALVMCNAPQLHAADRLAPGLYKGTSTIDGEMQPFTHCFTPDDAKNVNADAKAGRQYAEEAGKGVCKVTAYDITGDKVSVTMVCGPSITTSSATYHGDAFESDTTRRVQGTEHVIHTKAKRVGVCK